MSDESPANVVAHTVPTPEPKKDTFNLSIKDIVLLAGGIIGIMSFAGQWFVYGDKVKVNDARTVVIEAELKARGERLTVVEQWQKAADPVLIQMRGHVADRTLHTTPEDVSARVALQMQPFLVNMEGVKSDVKSLQKQSDRIEEMLKDMAAKRVSP